MIIFFQVKSTKKWRSYARKKYQKVHHKAIKKKYPDWKRLTKKEKKLLTKEVLDHVVKNYDYSQSIDISIEELTGIEEQLPSKGIIPIYKMPDYIQKVYINNLVSFDKRKKPYPEISDPELQFIDELIDDMVINSLIAPDNYSPAHRLIHPFQLVRMEILKILKYPEISYRKFCSEEYFGKERKQNRRFVRLPLNSNIMPDHTQLSHFRSSLHFTQTVNLLVYILHLFYKSKLLENTVIHTIDSTELPIETNYPLCTGKVKDKKIRIYADLDCDCGKRRNKRDKSSFFIGYRLHTLSAINPSTGHSFPLLSIVAAGNHHDSLFLKPLIKLGQAIGIDMKLITADSAYHDNDGSVLSETGVYVVAPPSEEVKLPDNVVESPIRVHCNDFCEIPMKHIGICKNGHEFVCNADFGECIFESRCPKSRLMPFDAGHFQPIASFQAGHKEAVGIRKNCERAFNLLKKREGLEQVRVRSQHGVVVRSAFTTIVTLLIEMADTRRKAQKNNTEQEEVFAATG